MDITQAHVIITHPDLIEIEKERIQLQQNAQDQMDLITDLEDNIDKKLYKLDIKSAKLEKLRARSSNLAVVHVNGDLLVKSSMHKAFFKAILFADAVLFVIVLFNVVTKILAVPESIWFD